MLRLPVAVPVLALQRGVLLHPCRSTHASTPSLHSNISRLPSGFLPTHPPAVQVCIAQRTGQRISGPLFFGFSDPLTQRAIATNLYAPAELAAALRVSGHGARCGCLGFTVLLLLAVAGKKCGGAGQRHGSAAAGWLAASGSLSLGGGKPALPA